MNKLIEANINLVKWYHSPASAEKKLSELIENIETELEEFSVAPKEIETAGANTLIYNQRCLDAGLK